MAASDFGKKLSANLRRHVVEGYLLKNNSIKQLLTEHRSDLVAPNTVYTVAMESLTVGMSSADV